MSYLVAIVQWVEPCYDQSLVAIVIDLFNDNLIKHKIIQCEGANPLQIIKIVLRLKSPVLNLYGDKSGD